MSSFREWVEQENRRRETARAAASEQRRIFAAEHGGEKALWAMAKIVGMWQVICEADISPSNQPVTADETPPKPIIYCDACNEADARCDEMVGSAEEATQQGWTQQVYRCGCETEEDWVCPAHQSQRVVDQRCGWCSR
jgi:hypothetical protein